MSIMNNVFDKNCPWYKRWELWVLLLFAFLTMIQIVDSEKHKANSTAYVK